jgi:hypothetical protein
MSQTGDPHSGTFTLTKTGTDRYDLLEAFKDVSNTQTGQTPGHMNFYPFGQPFVDPFDPPGGYNWRNWGTLSWEFGRGVVHGGSMVADAATLGLTPLNGYVDNLVQENGGGYGVARGSAQVGVTAATFATGVSGVNAARAALAARAARLAAAARAARIASLSQQVTLSVRAAQAAEAPGNSALAAAHYTRAAEIMELILQLSR